MINNPMLSQIVYENGEPVEVLTPFGEAEEFQNYILYSPEAAQASEEVMAISRQFDDAAHKAIRAIERIEEAWQEFINTPSFIEYYSRNNKGEGL